MKRNIACVVGARPNFVKMKPVIDGIHDVCPDLNPLLVHTGQHYDHVMSDQFFRQLHLPEPDVHLSVGSGRHGAQTAKILDRYEAWLIGCNPRPVATLVVGDVNSTLACALASAKLQVPVFHVEAGLRSFDPSMPEEINRIVTDALSELLFVSEPAGVENLVREGKPKSKIRLVGNVMIDALKANVPYARAVDHAQSVGVKHQDFALWTMHRPSNVDNPVILRKLVSALQHVARRIPVVFPVHPRTRSCLEARDLWCVLRRTPDVVLTAPLGYLDFLSISSQSRMIITDSGGLQEESTALRIPCLTLRENTERPITVLEGTSTLVGHDIELLECLVNDILEQRYKQGRCPSLWDGKAGLRVARNIAEFVANACSRGVGDSYTARPQAPSQQLVPLSS